MPVTYVPIASITVAGSSTSDVTFSSIPQTYTDLVLRATARMNRNAETGDLNFYLNGDGTNTSNYSQTFMFGNGSAAGSQRFSSTSGWFRFIIPGNTSLAGVFSSGELYIPNYRASANKPASQVSHQENNTTNNQSYFGAMLYLQTAAITAIQIRSFDGNLIAGSTFHLYGISNT